MSQPIVTFIWELLRVDGVNRVDNRKILHDSNITPPNGSEIMFADSSHGMDKSAVQMKYLLISLLVLLPVAVFAGHEFDNRDLNNGRILYKEHCATCHGTNREGQPNWWRTGKDRILPAPPHDETGHTWHHDNRFLIDYTKLGGQALMEARGIIGFASGMPGFGNVMSDYHIRDVLAYIRSTWPEDIRKIQTDRNLSHE